MLNREIHAAHLLVIRYRKTETESIPLGVALYVPAVNSVHFRFRSDFLFVHPDDFEFVAATGSTFEAIAHESGARAAALWMDSCLSNTVFAEGPIDVFTSDPEESVVEAYERIVK